MAEAAAVVGVISMGMQVAGGVVQGLGNVQALESSARAHDFNAQVAQQNETLSKQQAQEDARRFEVQGKEGLEASTQPSEPLESDETDPPWM
jgi:hypothetical protein